MAKQRLDRSGTARLRTTAWPKPIADDRWRGRTRLEGEVLAAAWAEFVGCVGWTRFWTLTFDPARRFPVGQELASREVFAWLKQPARVQRQPIAWVYAPERGPSGLWHAHALTIGTIDKVEDYMMLDWQLRNGHAHVAAVTDGMKAVMYATKEAALSGEVVCSDTLSKYRERLNERPIARLWPDHR